MTSIMWQPIVGKFDTSGSREGAAVVRFLLAISYSVLLFPIYIGLSKWWSYFGFSYKEPEKFLAVSIIVLAALPAIALPRKIAKWESFLVWVMYYLIYLPAMIIPFLQGYLLEEKLFLNFSLILIAMIGLIAFSRSKARPLAAVNIKPATFWLWLYAIYLLLNGYIVLTFGKTLTIASADTVYDQRYLGAAAIGGSYVGYALGAVANALNPFLIAVGIGERRWLPFTAGLLGQLLAFSTLALRATILSPIFIIGVFLLFRRDRTMPALHIAGVFIGAELICSALMFQYDPAAGGISEFVTLVALRTLYIAGTTFGVYAEFFSIYPLTYLSHANIINLFITYPYAPTPLPGVVGEFLMPSLSTESLSLNASFLATEGLASFGSVGILIATGMMILILGVIRKFIDTANARITCAAFVPFIVNIANASVLTAMITGGGVVLTLMIYLWTCTKNSETDKDGHVGASFPES